MADQRLDDELVVMMLVAHEALELARTRNRVNAHTAVAVGLLDCRMAAHALDPVRNVLFAHIESRARHSNAKTTALAGSQSLVEHAISVSGHAFVASAGQTSQNGIGDNRARVQRYARPRPLGDVPHAGAYWVPVACLVAHMQDAVAPLDDGALGRGRLVAVGVEALDEPDLFVGELGHDCAEGARLHEVLVEDDGEVARHTWTILALDVAQEAFDYSPVATCLFFN